MEASELPPGQRKLHGVPSGQSEKGARLGWHWLEDDQIQKENQSAEVLRGERGYINSCEPSVASEEMEELRISQKGGSLSGTRTGSGGQGEV